MKMLCPPFVFLGGICSRLHPFDPPRPSLISPLSRRRRRGGILPHPRVDQIWPDCPQVEEEVWKFGSYIPSWASLFSFVGFGFGAPFAFLWRLGAFCCVRSGLAWEERILKGGAIKQGSSVIGGEIFLSFLLPFVDWEVSLSVFGLYWVLYR